MSNIGKKPVVIKDGVQVTVADRIVVTGPKGTLSAAPQKGIEIVIEDGRVKVVKKEQSADAKRFYGLMRASINNMVIGVTTGFEKKLELIGVGYRAKMEGDTLVLNLGFANPVRFKSPTGITLSVAENLITVAGVDKQLVGDIAHKIREMREPDPYKGKGIRYQNEVVRRKVGKAAKAVGGK